MSCTRNSKGAKLPCPRCNSRANIVSSRNVTETYRETTFQCSSCGLRYVAGLSLVRITSMPPIEPEMQHEFAQLADPADLAPFITDRTTQAA